MTKDVGNDGGIEAAQLGKLLGDEGTNADILKTNRVYLRWRSRRSEARGRRPWVGQQTFDDESHREASACRTGQRTQRRMQKVPLAAMTWIFEGKTSDTDLKVNFSGP